MAAAVAGAKAQRDRINADEFIALSELGKQGMKINSYVDMQAFRRVLRPLYPALLPGVDLKLVEEIRAMR